MCTAVKVTASGTYAMSLCRVSARDARACAAGHGTCRRDRRPRSRKPRCIRNAVNDIYISAIALHPLPLIHSPFQCAACARVEDALAELARRSANDNRNTYRYTC